MLNALSAALGFASRIASAGRPRRERRRRNGLPAAVCVAMLALPAISCANAAEPAARPAKPPPAPPRPVTQKSVYEQRKRSAVRVEIQIPGTPRRILGAGLIVSESGYVITNRHVIEAPGPRKVIFFDGTSHPFHLVAAPRNMDLAIIKIDAGKKFEPLPLGRSSNVKAGDRVFALGNPGGRGLTISQGKVTAIGTTWRWGGPYAGKMIAFDAPIQGGNSGGPIVNVRGEAVGVVFCVAIGVRNLSFAAPIDGTVEFLHKTLAEDGLLFFELGMDVPAAGDGTVGNVAAGSPAARAGVKPGDRITNIGGAGVARGFDFHLALIGRAGGDAITLKLVRGGKPFETTIELGKMKARPAASIVRTAPGLAVQHYKGDWNRLPDFSKLKPVKSGVAKSIGIGPQKGKDHFALRFTGYVKAPAEGTYRFYVTSDDGGRLRIGGRVMANNDGLHPARTRGGRPIQLAAGLHPITVIYFEKSDNETLKVTWTRPGHKPEEIPASALFRVSPPR